MAKVSRYETAHRADRWLVLAYGPKGGVRVAHKFDNQDCADRVTRLLNACKTWEV